MDFFPGDICPGRGRGLFSRGTPFAKEGPFLQRGNFSPWGLFSRGNFSPWGGLFSRENIFTQEGPVTHLLPVLCEVFVLSSDCGLSQLVRRASFPSFPSDSRPRLPTIC